MTSETASGWAESGQRLPDGRAQVLEFIPTEDEKAAVLKGFLELNISKGERGKNENQDSAASAAASTDSAA